MGSAPCCFRLKRWGVGQHSCTHVFTFGLLYKYAVDGSMVLTVYVFVYCVQSLEVECMALEPKLHEVKASYDLLIDLRDGESAWEREGEDEALKGKEEAERRHQDLLNKLHTKKELLNAELSK